MDTLDYFKKKQKICEFYRSRTVKNDCGDCPLVESDNIHSCQQLEYDNIERAIVIVSATVLPVKKNTGGSPFDYHTTEYPIEYSTILDNTSLSLDFSKKVTPTQPLTLIETKTRVSPEIFTVEVTYQLPINTDVAHSKATYDSYARQYFPECQKLTQEAIYGGCVKDRYETHLSIKPLSCNNVSCLDCWNKRYDPSTDGRKRLEMATSISVFKEGTVVSSNEVDNHRYTTQYSFDYLERYNSENTSNRLNSEKESYVNMALSAYKKYKREGVVHNG